MGIPKSVLLNDYYYDEFIAVMDEYNEMHRIEHPDEDKAVYADDF